MSRASTSRQVRKAPPQREAVVEATVSPRTSDGDLVRRALEGDRWAEEALFRRHAPAVAATVMRLMGNRTDAEDVVQDTFVIALDKLHRLQSPEAVRPWLLRVAVREVQQRFRRRKLRRLLGLEGGGEPNAEVTCGRFANEQVGPDLHAELRLLDHALRELPWKERIAWMLRHVEGYSLEETADACGCSLATVKRRIAAAEVRVRRHARIAEEEDHG